MLTTEQKWNSMTPEERVCDEKLQYLAEEILESDWDDLAPFVQAHLIILLS